MDPCHLVNYFIVEFMNFYNLVNLKIILSIVPTVYGRLYLKGNRLKITLFHIFSLHTINKPITTTTTHCTLSIVHFLDILNTFLTILI